MRKGEIVEVGPHEELLERESGLYAHLWSLQSDQARASA
jgi:subfamily B ATP-binding cassette protein HlyB/CyaB